MSLTDQQQAPSSVISRQRIAELRIRCQQNPDSIEDHREAIAELLAVGLTQEALPLLNRLLARCPDDIDLATQLASTLTDGGDDRGALEQWRRVADMQPHSADAQHNLGIAACRVGDHATACRAFERKLELQPQSYETCNDLAVLYAMTGRLDEAADAYDRCLRINPRYDLGRENAFRFLYDNGRIPQGIALADRLLEAVGQDDDILAWKRRFMESRRKSANDDTRSHDISVKDNTGRTRVANKRIAFVASSDTFLKPIIAHFAPHNEVRQFAGTSIQELAELIRWADLTWFEWCDRFAIDGSQLPKSGKAVCRLHSYEAFTDAPAKMAWKNIDRLILVSRGVADVLDQFWKIPAERTIIHNGVDPDRLPLTERSVRGKRIAAVGYINYKKNPSLMLQTFKAIHNWDPEFEFHIAGDHQDPRIKVYMDHLLPRLGIPVTWHGWVDDMAAFYANMDYVISTSLFESFHYSIAEGMLSGCLPLIHSWKGADDLYPAECLFDTPDDAIGLIERYRGGDEEQIVRDHRDYIIERYNWRDRLDEIDRTLDEVLKGQQESEARHTGPIAAQAVAKSSADCGLVSVVIPTRNQAAKIADSVTSALNQSYRDIEVIVCDDGSTDETGEALQKFGDRIAVIRQVQRGLPGALNSAIQHSHGRYIAVLLGGDTMMPERIEKQVIRLAASGELGMIACNGQATDDPVLSPSTVMFRRKLIEQSGWFDETIPNRMAESDSLVATWRRFSEFAKSETLDEELIHCTGMPPQKDRIGSQTSAESYQRWKNITEGFDSETRIREHNHRTKSKATSALKIVFVGATDPGGQMAMWADALNRHTGHDAHVLIHSETQGCPSDLVIRQSGVGAANADSNRLPMATLAEAEAAARDADLVVFAAGLASGCLRDDARLEDTDEQSYGTIHWPDIIAGKRCAAILFGTPSVRGNLSWYCDRLSAKGWPVLTCEPDIHRWLPGAVYLPRLFARHGREIPAGKPPDGTVAIVHPGRRTQSAGATIFRDAATELKSRFPFLSIGRYEDMPHAEVLALKGRAQIAFDRIDVGRGTFGLDSIENSAIGLVNVVYCDPYARALLAETLGTRELPWLIADTKTALIDVLAKYLSDRDRLAQAMHDTRAWFETYWAEDKLAARVADSLAESIEVAVGGRP